MKRLLLACAVVAQLFLTSGCYTSVNVKRVSAGDKTTEGLRFCLPAKFLVGRLDSQTVFSSDDISDFDVLAQQLAGGSDISKFVFGSLTARMQQQLKQYVADTAASDQVKSDLIAALNAILRSTPIVDPKDTNRLKGVRLPKEVADLASRPAKTQVEIQTVNFAVLTNVYSRDLLFGGNPPGVLDIPDLGALTTRLQNGGEGISQYLWGAVQNTMSPPSKDALLKFAKAVQDAQMVAGNLAKQMDLLLRGPLVNTNLLTDAQVRRLTSEAKSLINAKPQTGDDLARANRLILQSAFPAALKITPRHISYDVEMLPDPDQQYAISSVAWLAKQKVAVKRSIEMYLTKLDLNQDATTLAAAIAGAGAQIPSAFQPAQPGATNNVKGGGASSTTTTTTSTQTSSSNNQSSKSKAGQSPGGTDQSQTDQTSSDQSNAPSSTTVKQTVETKTVVSTAGPIKVMYRIIDSDDGGQSGIKLEPVKLTIFDYHLLTQPAKPATASLLN